jgi:hypothetical protein
MRMEDNIKKDNKGRVYEGIWHGNECPWTWFQ